MSPDTAKQIYVEPTPTGREQKRELRLKNQERELAAARAKMRYQPPRLPKASPKHRLSKYYRSLVKRGAQGVYR